MSADEKARKGMRGHSDAGQVRPADNRYNLHRPEDESAYVRSDKADKPKRRNRREAPDA